jgi:hypothetical protein
MAPERIKGESVGSLGAYTVSSDVWSVGLTAIEMALGHYPYPPGARTVPPSYCSASLTPFLRRRDVLERVRAADRDRARAAARAAGEPLLCERARLGRAVSGQDRRAPRDVRGAAGALTVCRVHLAPLTMAPTPTAGAPVDGRRPDARSRHGRVGCARDHAAGCQEHAGRAARAAAAGGRSARRHRMTPYAMCRARCTCVVFLKTRPPRRPHPRLVAPRERGEAAKRRRHAAWPGAGRPSARVKNS